MIMDLVFQKQKEQKGSATSQRRVLSLQPVPQQIGLVSAFVISDLHSINLKSSVKIFLMSTQYCFMDN